MPTIAEVVIVYVLMFRPHSHTTWQQIGDAGTHSEIVALIGSGGRHGGCWWIRRVDPAPPEVAV